jgi:hypothetical protein
MPFSIVCNRELDRQIGKVDGDYTSFDQESVE